MMSKHRDHQASGCPWDQALDTILLSNNLGSPLMEIFSRSPRLTSSQNKKRRPCRPGKRGQTGTLKKALIPISYAQAKDLKPVIQIPGAFKEGEHRSRPATNTLIVIDIQKNIEKREQSLIIWIRPIPQVLIEAKIIQINPTYTKELGVSWGGDIKPAPAEALSLERVM
jgi:type IV pilus assembly protein PilQ